jgi:hypothetical protein
MAKITDFGKLNWFSSNNIISNTDYAEIMGTIYRKGMYIFCNNKTISSAPSMFGYKYKNEISNDIIYFKNSKLERISNISSVIQISQFVIVATAMTSTSVHNILYWKQSFEAFNKNRNQIDIRKIEYIDNINKKMIILINSQQIVNFVVTDLTVAGITYNNTTTSLLISINCIFDGSKANDTCIVISIPISININTLKINTENMKIVSVINLNSVTLNLKVKCKTLYLTDICFKNNLLYILVDYITGGYVLKIKFYKHLNKFSSLPSIIQNDYDDDGLVLEQKPTSLCLAKDGLIITLKRDKSPVFDYIIIND